MKIEELLKIDHELLNKIDQRLSDQEQVLGVIMDFLSIEKPVVEQSIPMPPPEVALKVNPKPNGELLKEESDYDVLFDRTRDLGKELGGVKAAMIEMDTRFRKLSEYTAQNTLEVQKGMDTILQVLKAQKGETNGRGSEHTSNSD